MSPSNKNFTKNAKDAAIAATKTLLKTAHVQEAELKTVLPAYKSNFEEDMVSDKEKDVDAPILEAVYLLEGQEGLKTLTNFTSEDLDKLWSKLQDHVQANWNVGHGWKVSHKPKDVMVMLLATLKRGESWDSLVQSFQMSIPDFEK